MSCGITGFHLFLKTAEPQSNRTAEFRSEYQDKTKESYHVFNYL